MKINRIKKIKKSAYISQPGSMSGITEVTICERGDDVVRAVYYSL